MRNFICPGSSLRPADLFIHTFENGQAAAVVVSVVHPLQINTNFKVGFVSSQRELSEEKLYHDICVRAGFLFFPVVVETTGGWGPRSVTFMRKLFRAYCGRKGGQTDEYLAELWGRVSAALARSIARQLCLLSPST